jgi:hypothetical protein
LVLLLIPGRCDYDRWVKAFFSEIEGTWFKKLFVKSPQLFAAVQVKTSHFLHLFLRN